MINNSVELIRPVNGSRDRHAIVMPQSANHDEYSSFSKRENRKALRPKTHAKHDEYSSVSKRENLTALYISQSNEYSSFSKREDSVALWFTSRTIGKLHKYLHTDDKQSSRTYTIREWLERDNACSSF